MLILRMLGSMSISVGKTSNIRTGNATETGNALVCKQVTRGHNIVADGWAGAFKPHPHPNPTAILKHSQNSI